MKPHSPWFLLILLTSITSDKQRTTGSKASRNGENIGTVLFERGDCAKRCWSTEEFTILNSRRMFQDILPKVKVIDYQNDQYIALLMDYFHVCLETVRKLSIGKTKHLMLKALADAMGGYLRAYILPLTKQSYYAGNIKYHNARKLFELYDELMDFLHTNGAGWSKSRREIVSTKTSPIVITPSELSVACNGLITYPIHDNYNRNRRSRRRHARRKKKRFVSRHKSKRYAAAGYNDAGFNNDEQSTIVPLPFLDDENEPNSIALPFKSNSLQSLYSERSVFVLVKYYVASVKCIVSRSQSKAVLDNFNTNFFAWLKQSVRRHLNDEKWYPAFGGVLRVISSLEESGSGKNMELKGGSYQMMPKMETEHSSVPVDDVPPLYKGKSESNDILTFGTTELIIIAVVSALLVWLLVGLSLVCYRYLSRHSEECSPCESPNTPVAVLYENTDYTKGDACVSKTVATKGPIEKLKEWYKSKFGRCPGGCQNRYDEERCLAAISYTSKDTTPGSRICHRKKYVTSTSASPSSSPVERTIFRQNVCYSSDASSTVSEEPGKRRR
ncbi:hypothetical protein KPH14_008867 [Odynerus spinipes]|uniref:Uncharacterized protein n=1 Tax=Odynerus spinipes TaxID=1348599 RepID=A0AAD9VL40_9HYME|nr:hypothetical protein KPH14_008867 [Odynerus spinipes]